MIKFSSLKALLTKRNIALILILILAAYLRLYKIADYMSFLGDEGRDALVVYGILHGKLTLLGPTASVGGFFLGPIYYYMIAPFFFLFNYSPLGPAVFIALLSIATVWLIYKIGAEFFDYKVGLIAAFLYSIAPVVITYAHSSWNPNPLPFFSLLTLYVLYKALIKDKVVLFLLTGFLLGIDIQLHYLVLFLGVIVFFYVLFMEFFNKKKAGIINLLKKYLLMLAGFLVGFSPFLAFEARHDFLNIRNIISFIFKSGDTGGNVHFFSTVSNVFFRVFGDLVFAFPADTSHFDKIFILDWSIGIVIFALLSVIILVSKLILSVETKMFPRYLLLFFWLFFGVALFGLYKKNIYDYYFGFMFPLPFFLSAITIAYFIEKKDVVVKILGGLMLISILAFNLQKDLARGAPNRQFFQMEEISKFVLSKTDNKPFNFALITGGNSDFAYRYFFTIWNHEPVTIENAQNDPQRKTVTDQLLVVCESLPCQPLGHPLWEIAGFGRAELAGEWNVSVVKVYRLTHYKLK